MLDKLISRISAAPRESIYLGAALILILFQLSAIGALARGQIEKAEQRESLQLAQRMQVIRCLESRSTRIDVCAAQRQAVEPGAETAAASDSPSELVAQGANVLRMAWQQ